MVSVRAKMRGEEGRDQCCGVAARDHEEILNEINHLLSEQSARPLRRGADWT